MLSLPYLYSHHLLNPFCFFCLFFFNDPATTEIYTLSLHDALPIFMHVLGTAAISAARSGAARAVAPILKEIGDRKSTRLNSSHSSISYAVFCLKKKKKKRRNLVTTNKCNTSTSPTVNQSAGL